MRERHEPGAVFVVVKQGVTLREGTARSVLTRKTNARAFNGERGKRERLGVGPIKGHFAAGDLEMRVEELLDLGMWLKIVRQRRLLLQQLLKLFLRNPCFDFILWFGTAKIPGPDAARFVGGRRGRFGGGQLLFKLLLTGASDLIRFLAGNTAEPQ